MDKKSYLVLARKYRPQTFDEVVGQEAIATTLKNAVELGRVGHAYLFTGPRGVGKTSMARIFAKALNCVKGPTVKPCGECVACTEIESSRSLDVLEIDGASNRGIDEIRALRENVKFAPAAGHYKIYIIDEVHQITTDGFNALLKTLEEPPPHVKFIFATTTYQKVPATILSRCQRFDFRRITNAEIVSQLGMICKKERIKVDEEALKAIARSADGGLRDAESILDQVISASEGEVTSNEVVATLGILDDERLTAVSEALIAKDAPAAVRLLDAALREGKDPSFFAERLLEHVRNLLFVKASPELQELIEAGEGYKKELLDQAKRLESNELFYFFAVISHALQTLRRYESKRIPLEVALIKLAHRVPMTSIAEISEKLKAFEKSPSAFAALARPEPAVSRPTGAPASKQTPAPQAEKPAPKPPEARASAVSTNPSPKSLGAAQAVLEEDPKDEPEELPDGDLELAANMEKSVSLEAVWQPLINALKSEKISVATYLSEGQPAQLSNNVARVHFPTRLNFHKECLEVPDNRKLIEKHLSRLLGCEIRAEFLTIKQEVPENEAEPKPGPQNPVMDEEVSEEVKGFVQSAINLLGGKIIQS